jgi:hypothetical protein
MRLMKPENLESISQVLAKGACPICAYLRNDQAALLRGDMKPDEVSDLCNFHAWALAAAVDKDYVARIFLNVLARRTVMRQTKPDAARCCSFCSLLVQREVVHIRELMEQMSGGLVLDWVRRQGTFCSAHAAHLRQLAPLKFHSVIDEVMERSAANLASDLQDLLHRTAEGRGTGGGVLGRVAEFLVAQRGLNL